MTWQRPGPPRLTKPAASDDDRDRRRRWLPLLLLLLVPLCLWLASQLALLALGLTNVNESLLSKLGANYVTWEPGQFAPLNPALIGTIRADQATFAAGFMPGGGVIPFSPGETQPGVTPTVGQPSATIVAGVTATQGGATGTAVIFPPLPTLPPTIPPQPTGSSAPPPTSGPPTDTPPPTPQVRVRFASASASVAENVGSGFITITVTLNNASSQTVTVNYATSDGSALDGLDYTGVSGMLTFLPGQTSRTFNVPILDNAIYEGNETFIITLSNANNAVIGNPSVETITILEDDPPPVVAFTSAVYGIPEGTGPNTIISVTVSLTGATSSWPVTVDYATSDITAFGIGIPGIPNSQDYIPTSGTLTFNAPGIQSFNITLLGDAIAEPNEDIQIQLSNVSANATIGAPNPAIVTIIDDDGPPPIDCTGTPGALPNVGAPDGVIADIPCGSGVVVDMGAGNPITNDGVGSPSWDMVFYENYLFPDIALDDIVVQVGASPNGPWSTVFWWGDGTPDTNTNLTGTGCAVESDNLAMPDALAPPCTLLDGGTGIYFSGIAIDLDGIGVIGTFRYVRLYSPVSTDSAQADAIQSLP